MNMYTTMEPNEKSRYPNGLKAKSHTLIILGYTFNHLERKMLD